MVFITTINNISAISWQSVVLVENTGLHTSSIVIDKYSNFGNTCTYLSKEFTRVLGPGQIVTSLEHLGTVPGVQAWTTSVLCQVFK